MKLSEALRITNPTTIAIVGAGGKTTALFQLARELTPCLLTTTTHIGSWQTDGADRHFIWLDNAPMPDFEKVISTGIFLITGELENGRFKGLSHEKIDLLKQLARYHDLPLIIEADGARQKSLKAPAEHEPNIPPDMDVVIFVAGLSGVGKRIRLNFKHREQKLEINC
jgi:probable selenium-dependent hydroxylase accessory protein YqeC